VGEESNKVIDLHIGESMKTFRLQDGYSEQELLHSAVDHLASAKILFNNNARCFDSAGYLSQLGIELVLKAFLLNKTGQFPDKHSLIYLSDSIEEQGLNLNYTTAHKEILTTLDEFYELRYPSASNSAEIGEDDWERIEALFEHLILLLPTSIQQDLRKIDHSCKGKRILMMKKKDV